MSPSLVGVVLLGLFVCTALCQDGTSYSFRSFGIVDSRDGKLVHELVDGESIDLNTLPPFFDIEMLVDDVPCMASPQPSRNPEPSMQPSGNAPSP
eukprot:CAMPEP_0177673428 /NCGR_PEP_ID=MMETSP0447-20121125/25937_1 /TAXON_ID=0 /ORGANISM="Stygamoeba regulata, Strain BSH-02190019" /LENGTH=94 /DNA_ID=CAMNT_0019181297 /DNA_START=134 /DNA_END=415 /DNA_ORIENTATION=-